MIDGKVFFFFGGGGVGHIPPRKNEHMCLCVSVCVCVFCRLHVVSIFSS